LLTYSFVCSFYSFVDQLSHRALVDEVTDQIKLFSVKGRNCKRAIEGLIERGYMVRHATLEKTYIYKG
jgi:hypothetical protein